MSKDTGRARLPGLPAVRSGNVELDRWIAAAAERLEVREGARGNPYERVVTLRDLQALGIDPGALSGRGGLQGPLVQQPGGDYARISADAFSEAIVQSRAYRELSRRLDDPARFDALPEQVRALLLLDIAQEAAARGAAIERVERTLHSATSSLAMRVEEVTAAVEGAQAGLRETLVASTEINRAVAGRITQLQARLDGVGGVTIEESLLATADRVDGLAGEWMLKINAGRAVAGIGLAASEDPDGTTRSSFLVQADTFGVTGTYQFAQETPPAATQAGQTWFRPSLQKSYRAGAPGTGNWVEFTPAVPFGVDTLSGATYINGSLRVGPGGIALEDALAGNAAGAVLAEASSAVFFLSADGATSVPGGTTLRRRLENLSGGTTTWSVVVGSFTGSLATLSEGQGDLAPFGPSAMATDAVTFRCTYTVAGESVSDDITVTKVRTPVAGYLSNETASLPASATGTISDYSAASGVFRVATAQGPVAAARLAFSVVGHSGFGTAFPDLTGISIHPSSGVYAVTGNVAADSAQVTLRAVYTDPLGAPGANQTVIDKVLTLTKARAGAQGLQGQQGQQGLQGPGGPSGADGAAHVTAASGASSAGALSQAQLDSAFLSAAGRWRRTGDALTLHNASARWSQTWVHNGSSWGAAVLYIDGNAVITGTLYANTISTTKVVIRPIGAYVSGPGGVAISGGEVDIYVGTSSAIETPLWSFAMVPPSGAITSVVWYADNVFRVRALAVGGGAYTGTIPLIKLWIF